MKNILKKLAYKMNPILKLFYVLILLFGGFITCCLLGSWSYDINGNLVGNNLFDGESISQSNSWHMNITNINLTPNTTYTITNYTSWNALCSSCQIIDLNNNSTTLWSNVYNNSKFFSYNVNNSGIVFTTPSSNLNFIRLYFQFASQNSLPSLNNLRIMLNIGDSPEPWEPYEIYYSQNNYNLARTNNSTTFYQVFNGSVSTIYDDHHQFYYNGNINRQYLAYINDNTSGELTYTYSLNNTDNSLILHDYADGSVSNSEATDFLEQNPRGSVLFVPKNAINYTLYIHTDDSTFDYVFQALYLDGSVYTINNTSIQPYLYLVKIPASIDNPIIAFSYDYYYPDYMLSNCELVYDTAGIDFLEYYNRGYSSAKALYQADNSHLSRQLETLQFSYNDLQNQYDSLLNSYNNLSNSNIQLNFQSLIWTIASTPFESFKTIWNVDFLGFNIASFVTGILSVLVIVWILKKIF